MAWSCSNCCTSGEVRSITDIDIPKIEVKDAEFKLAKQLIDQQTSPEAFDPSAYTDTVSARIQAAVQRKVEGQEITLAERRRGGAQVIDLMEALRASLEKKTPAKPGAGRLAQAAEAGPAGAGSRRRRARNAQDRQEKSLAGDFPVSCTRMASATSQKLLHLSRSTIRSLIAAGFVAPARGARNAWLFTFQDLIVLRTAQALAEAKVPQRRITRSLKELRRHLPKPCRFRD